jgi:hypothetical protein
VRVPMTGVPGHEWVNREFANLEDCHA